MNRRRDGRSERNVDSQRNQNPEHALTVPRNVLVGYPRSQRIALIEKRERSPSDASRKLSPALECEMIELMKSARLLIARVSDCYTPLDWRELG